MCSSAPFAPRGYNIACSARAAAHQGVGLLASRLLSALIPKRRLRGHGELPSLSRHGGVPRALVEIIDSKNHPSTARGFVGLAAD